MDEMLVSMITLSCIPVLIYIAYAIYKVQKRHAAKQELLEGARKPDYRLSESCQPNDTTFVEQKCVFYHRAPGPIGTDDIRTLMQNARRRIARKYIHPFEEDTTIEMACLDYNAISQIARIDFKLRTSYRTITGYKQISGVKYRIYSDPKIKERYYRETFHVTADALERLDHPADEIVRLFREEVVIRLDCVTAVPSWAIKKWLQEERSAYEHYLDDLVAHKNRTLINASHALEAQSPALNKTISKKTHKIEILNAKLQNRTGKRADKLQTKINSAQSIVSACTSKLKELQGIAETSKSELEAAELKKQSTMEMLEKEVPALIKSVRRLNQEDPAANGFVLLAQYMLKPYTKITGVYVIRNNKNERCYVGQSKDVIRRLKQHFRNNQPVNPIFQHDYDMASSTERETLFSVKVIPLESKDELDRVEKDLISVYFAYATGYNSTKGNT